MSLWKAENMSVGRGGAAQGHSLEICCAGWETLLFELQQVSDRVNVVLES